MKFTGITAILSMALLAIVNLSMADNGLDNEGRPSCYFDRTCGKWTGPKVYEFNNEALQWTFFNWLVISDY